MKATASVVTETETEQEAMEKLSKMVELHKKHTKEANTITVVDKSTPNSTPSNSQVTGGGTPSKSESDGALPRHLTRHSSVTSQENAF